MELLAFAIILCIGFVVGYKYDHIEKALKRLQEGLEAKRDKKQPDQEKSAMVDPFDLAQKARMEHEELMRTLNRD